MEMSHKDKIMNTSFVLRYFIYLCGILIILRLSVSESLDIFNIIPLNIKI